MRIEPLEVTEEESSPPPHSWPAKHRTLKSGRYHLVSLKDRNNTAFESPSEGASAGTATACGVKFVYDRKLSATDTPRVIRLLKVLPGRERDPIVCELHYIALDHSPYYEAISYCWGSQVNSVTIDCNGQPLRITENLSAAIMALRPRGESLLVWADAVCIDQESIEEKNSQVPVMRLIYQNAAKVQVWLGHDTPAKTCWEAFDLLQQLYHGYSKLGWNFDIFTKQPVGEVLGSHQLPPLSDSSWASLLELARRPWFTRAWIIQEVIVSRRALLRCENMELPWKTFCFGFLFAMRAGLLTYQPTILRHPFAYQHLVALIVTYVCFVDSTYEQFDLLSLLQSHRCVDATDPKDKIYALLGLSAEIESQKHELIPNYVLPTEEIYAEVSRSIISKAPTLDLLGVPRAVSSPLTERISSWVTDWSVRHLGSSFTSKSLQGDYMFNFNATPAHIPKQITFRGSSLILNGHIFDIIVQVGKVMTPFKLPPVSQRTTSEFSISAPGAASRMLHILLVLQDWRSMNEGFSSIRPYKGTPDALLKVFCRTIYLDKMPEGYDLTQITQDYGRYYYRLVSLILSYIFRYSVAFKVLEWWEARLMRHALIRAGENTKATSFPDMIARTVERRMVITKSGYLGLAPELAEPGQCIALVKGAKVPLVLRLKENAKWELIGDCYIHGIMHGEAFEVQKCIDIEVE